MGDLIDRQAAIEELRRMAIALYGYDATSVISCAIYKLQNLPSAQPELVWCKDCKWYDTTHPYGTVIPDAFHCKVNDKFYKASHFCGYGERRE